MSRLWENLVFIYFFGQFLLFSEINTYPGRISDETQRIFINPGNSVNIASIGWFVCIFA